MFSDRLKSLRKKNGLTQQSVASSLGISNGTVGNWESGNRIPDSNMLKRLSDFFEVSIDYLLGNSDYEGTVGEHLSDIEYALYGEIHELSEEEKQRIIDFVRFTKSQRR